MNGRLPPPRLKKVCHGFCGFALEMKRLRSFKTPKARTPRMMTAATQPSEEKKSPAGDGADVVVVDVDDVDDVDIE